MSNYLDSTPHAAKVLGVALGLVESDEVRLREIIESKETSPADKYQAIIDLALMTAILVREMNEDQLQAPVSANRPNRLMVYLEAYIEARDKEAIRLRAVIESDESPPEHRFQALGELAQLVVEINVLRSRIEG